jgi:hypothetical protein
MQHGAHSRMRIWSNYKSCTCYRSVPYMFSVLTLSNRHRHGGRSPGSSRIPGDTTPWYQCGNPDEFVFMNMGNRISDNRSPFMKEMTTINGAFAYTMLQGNCDLGKLYVRTSVNT